MGLHPMVAGVGAAAAASRARRRTVLCLVPRSPPITGAAAASERVVQTLEARHSPTVIGYERGDLESGSFSFRQAVNVLRIAWMVLVRRRRFDQAYLVISSSAWGNTRDLALLFVLGPALRSQTVLHLHGANLRLMLDAASPVRRALARRLFGSCREIIVLGDKFRGLLSGYVEDRRVRVVFNCYDRSLLIPPTALEEKLGRNGIVRTLYLSNMITEKGYLRLLEAFFRLSERLRAKFFLDFAGAFPTQVERDAFARRIQGIGNIQFHGPVEGDRKRQLLWKADVLCLPTFYRYEGQPLSILEAYAAGCVVVTCNNGGIEDVFHDGENGFGLPIQYEVEELATVLGKVIEDEGFRRRAALFNHSEAVSKYGERRFCDEMARAFEE